MGQGRSRWAEMDTAQVLRAAGLAVVDARIGGRGHLEIRGGMVHHDAVAAGITRSRGIQVMQQGRSDLPGPLCNAWLERDGTWCLITDGRANHAGSCSHIALSEAFAGRISASTRDARDRALLDDTTIGNRYLFGVEVANNGVGESYPSVQIDSLAQGIVAINAACGLTSGHWLHHRQATRRKIDMSWRGDLWSLIDQHDQEDDMAKLEQHIGKTRRPDGTTQHWFIEGSSSVPISADTADMWHRLGVPVLDDAATPLVLAVKAKGTPAA